MPAGDAAHPEDVCQFCGTSLLWPIPVDRQYLYGNQTHGRREIHVEPDDVDVVLYFVCPDCHRAWPQTFPTITHGTWAEGLPERAAVEVAAHNAAVAVFADHDHVVGVLREHRETIGFAFGMSGLRWTGWAVAPQTGDRLYLRVDPVSGWTVNADQVRGSSTMIATATGWSNDLLVVAPSRSVLVRNVVQSNAQAFHLPPTRH